MPQKNTTYPQMYIYDFEDISPENVKGIHYILTFQAEYTSPPSVVLNNNRLEIVGGSKRTGVSIPMSSNRAGFNPRLVPSYFANYRDKSGLV